MQESGNKLVRRAVALLKERLPTGWSVKAVDRVVEGETKSFLVFESPDRIAALQKQLENDKSEFGSSLLRLLVNLEQDVPRRGERLAIARATWDVRTFRAIRERLSLDSIPAAGSPWIIIGEYVPASLRAEFEKTGINYLDLTGNIRIYLDSPGLAMRLLGADSDPRTSKLPRRIDFGKLAAARIAKFLITTRELPTVREIGVATQTDFTFAARILAHLDAEGIVTRNRAGRLTAIDWEALLRRWAKDSPLDSRGRIRRFLDPHGLTNAVQRVGMSNVAHTISGSFAAARYAQVVSPRLLLVYLSSWSVSLFVDSLGLEENDTHPNVLVIEDAEEIPEEPKTDPNDDFVFFASPVQVACDLLNSPGRGPEEAEAVIEWMMGNLDAWKR